MLTRAYIQNPHLLILTVVLIAVAGISSLLNLPRIEDPILTPRFASITTLYPGASAERIEQLVSEKIEAALAEVPEIKELSAVNRASVSFIAVELNDDVTKETVPSVWSKIRDKITDAHRLMPQQVAEPEFEQLEVKANAQLIGLVWTRTSPPQFSILRRLAKSLQDRLDEIPGTEKTTIFGDCQEEILVELKLNQLQSLQLTPWQIAQQIAASDAKVPAGQLRSRKGDLMLEVAGELDTLTRIAQIPIRQNPDGQTIHLSELGHIQRTIPDPPPAKSLVQGKPALVVGVLVKDTQRLDLWNNEALATLDKFAAELPPGIELIKVFEQIPYVEQRFQELAWNFISGGIGVMAIVFLFMGWRSAIVVGTTLPLACLMVMSALLYWNIPLHQMSITGLVIAMGLLIDNAIVVVDEIAKRWQQGMERTQAIRESVAFLAVPLIGSTATTVFSFAPIALMPGSSGEFVGAIAISTIIAVTSSFFLAITVVPGLSRLILNEHQSGWETLLNPGRIPERLFRGTLGLMFRVPRLTLLLLAIPSIFGLACLPYFPEQFFPPADRDQFQMELELPATASLHETESIALEIRELAREIPAIEEVTWFLGESAPAFYYNIVPQKRNVPNYGQALVKCRDRKSTPAAIAALQKLVDQRYPQAHCVVRQLEQGPPFFAPIEVRLYGPQSARLQSLGEQIRLVMTQTPGITHTRTELSEVIPKIVFNVDEDQVRLAGLDQTSIAQTLQSLLEGSTGGSILEGTEELPIRVRINAAERRDLAAVTSLMLFAPPVATLIQSPPETATSLGGVPLDAVAATSLRAESSGTIGKNGRRLNEIQGFLPAGVLPGVVLKDFQSRLATSGFELPAGYSLEFGGAAGERNEAVGNLLVYTTVLMTMLVATLILALNSFRLAALVGLVVLFSVGASCGALWSLGYPFGFMAIVGIMGMIGVSVNDSIVVLAALQEKPLAETDRVPAIVDLVVHNTRHVLVTSLTTLVGFIPLMLGGGEFWPPVAICIGTGVAWATVLALVFVPAGYLCLVPRHS